MSTLKVNDIEEATNNGGKVFFNRCWVDYAPQSNGINGSGALSSIADNAIGDQTFNFSNANLTAYYSYGGCGYDDALGNSDDGVTTCGYATKNSTQIRMISGYRNVEYDYDGFSYFFGIN